MSVKNIIGNRFGRLEIIGFSERKDPNGRIRTICRCLCDCGTIKDILEESLCRGLTQSCGCLRNERTVLSNRKHGHSVAGMKGEGTRAYKVWRGIKQRCTNPKETGFKHYGGRGIAMCDRWFESFENFLSDMGEPPLKTFIDRIDNNMGYSPENCRWATRKEQNRNQRKNKMLTMNGKTQCLSAWAEELNIRGSTIDARLKRGWSEEKALATPVRKLNISTRKQHSVVSG